jgi:hypothetical protein
MKEAARNQLPTKADRSVATAGGMAQQALTSVQEVAGRASDAVNQVLDSDSAHAVLQTVEQGITEAGHYFSEAQDQAVKAIRKYPVQSVLIGFGVGALFASLFRGSRHG